MKNKNLLSLLALMLCAGFLSAQNVGIGTTNPEAKLHIVDGALRMEDSASGAKWEFAYDANGEHFYIDESGVARHFVVSKGGDVGIGTANPKYDFHISAGATSGLNIGAGNGMVITSADLPRLYFEDADAEVDKKVMFQEYRDGKYKISATNDAGTAFINENLFVVNSNGNVGVGRPDPEYKLDVEHQSFGLAIRQTGTQSHWELYQENFVEGDLALWNTNNKVGGFDYSSGSYFSTSDRKLKRDITPLSTVLPSLMQLQATSYFYASDKEKKSNIGFIAQEVEKLFPELVMLPKSDGKKEGDGNYLMNYAGFGVLAVKAIQEQQEIIEVQNKKIGELEVELAAIKAALAQAGITVSK